MDFASHRRHGRRNAVDSRIRTSHLAKGRCLCFDRHPFLVNDPVFQDVWGDAAAIYAGDRNLDRVLNALDIRVLDDEVCVEPIYGERQSDVERRVDNRLREAAPALIALAATAVPSRRLELAHRLNDLKVVCSSEIVLKYTLEGFKPRIDETSSVFVDAAGIVYVQTVDSNPDWPSLALRLAAYLDVESGDGFVIVLTSNQDVREDFLRARHLSNDDLLAASKALQVGVPGELGQEDRYVVVDQADDASQEVDETDPDTAAVIDQDSEVIYNVEPIVVRPGPHSSGNRAPGPGTGPPTQPAARPHIDSAGAAWGSETACQGGLAAKRPEVRDSRYFSYVVAQGSDDARIAERMDSEAMHIGNYGVQQVVAYEARFGRTAEPQAHNNRGFDVISAEPDGSSHRVIEVKATTGAWPARGIPVSKHQVDKNLESGDEFWLYIVEFATDPGQARVIPIQNRLHQSTITSSTLVGPSLPM